MSRVVVITGGTSGFGLATIKVFLREEKGNVQIVSLSRSTEKQEKAKKELGEDSKYVEFLQADISNVDELTKVAKHIEEKYGKVDVLINNAGTIIPGGLESLSEEDWDWVIKNNLSSYFYTTKAFVPLLKKAENSNIVNLSSTSSKMGGSSIAYSVSKAGVVMLTKASAKELAKYKIRVNAVSAGVANTGFHVNNGVMNEEEYSQLLERTSKNYPLGIGESMDVAEVIYFLSTDKAKWMTGSDVWADGGRSIN